MVDCRRKTERAVAARNTEQAEEQGAFILRRAF